MPRSLSTCARWNLTRMTTLVLLSRGSSWYSRCRCAEGVGEPSTRGGRVPGCCAAAAAAAAALLPGAADTEDAREALLGPPRLPALTLPPARSGAAAGEGAGGTSLSVSQSREKLTRDSTLCMVCSGPHWLGSTKAGRQLSVGSTVRTVRSKPAVRATPLCCRVMLTSSSTTLALAHMRVSTGRKPAPMALPTGAKAALSPLPTLPTALDRAPHSPARTPPTPGGGSSAAAAAAAAAAEAAAAVEAADCCCCCLRCAERVPTTTLRERSSSTRGSVNRLVMRTLRDCTRASSTSKGSAWGMRWLSTSTRSSTSLSSTGLPPSRLVMCRSRSRTTMNSCKEDLRILPSPRGSVKRSIWERTVKAKRKVQIQQGKK